MSADGDTPISVTRFDTTPTALVKLIERLALIIDGEPAGLVLDALMNLMSEVAVGAQLNGPRLGEALVTSIEMRRKECL